MGGAGLALPAGYNPTLKRPTRYGGCKIPGSCVWPYLPMRSWRAPLRWAKTFLETGCWSGLGLSVWRYVQATDPQKTQVTFEEVLEDTSVFSPGFDDDV